MPLSDAFPHDTLHSQHDLTKYRIYIIKIQMQPILWLYLHVIDTSLVFRSFRIKNLKKNE